MNSTSVTSTTSSVPVHPYFRGRAEAVFAEAGGDPAAAGPLAAWAQQVKQSGQDAATAGLGVVVADDGRLIAITKHSTGWGVRATYVTGLLVDDPQLERAHLVGLEVGLATARIAGKIGHPVIHVRASQVCTGKGF